MERITLPCETMTMNERTLKESHCPVKPWQWMKGLCRNHTALWNHDNEWKDFEGITLPCETMTMNLTLNERIWHWMKHIGRNHSVKPWQWIWHWQKGHWQKSHCEIWNQENEFELEERTLTKITLWNHHNNERITLHISHVLKQNPDGGWLTKSSNIGKANVANQGSGKSLLNANTNASCENQTGGIGQDETVTPRAEDSAVTRDLAALLAARSLPRLDLGMWGDGDVASNTNPANRSTSHRSSAWQSHQGFVTESRKSVPQMFLRANVSTYLAIHSSAEQPCPGTTGDAQQVVFNRWVWWPRPTYTQSAGRERSSRMKSRTLPLFGTRAASMGSGGVSPSKIATGAITL